MSSAHVLALPWLLRSMALSGRASLAVWLLASEPFSPLVFSGMVAGCPLLKSGIYTSYHEFITQAILHEGVHLAVCVTKYVRALLPLWCSLEHSPAVSCRNLVVAHHKMHFIDARILTKSNLADCAATHVTAQLHMLLSIH